MKRIALVLLCALILEGCEKKGVSEGVQFTQDIAPSIIEVGNNPTMFDSYYCYLVDKNTGVVYLTYHDNYRYGVTVMLNRDGSPVTSEQLGIRY